MTSEIEVINLDEEQQNADWIMSPERRKEYIKELWPLVAEKPITEGGKPRPQPPGVKTAKAPLDKIGSVLNLYSQAKGNIAERATEIFQMSRSAYDAALTASIAELGCSGNAHLTGGPELKALRERSKWSAETIARTYHKDLVHILEGAVASWRESHNGTEEGMTRKWLAKQARVALDVRSKWKEPQIAITEKAFAVDRARLDFWRNNQVDGEVRVMPLEAVCEICQGYVDRGWVSLREAERSFTLPAHCSCPHILEIRARKDTVPKCEDLWRGGTKAEYAREGMRQIIEVLEFNPYHEPAGTPGGGQFAHGPNNDIPKPKWRWDVNPHYKPGYFAKQNGRLEQIPKIMKDRDAGFLYEAAGDIFREYNKRMYDPGYIQEKVNRIRRYNKDIITGRDRELIEEWRKGFLQFEYTTPTMLAFKDLVNGMADRNLVFVESALKRIESDYTD